MPYIPTDRRRKIIWSDDTVRTAGELNFFITRAVDDYVREHGLSYQTINDVLGALDGAGREFYRRVAAPYEDTKIAANGDVYSPAVTQH